jgi:histidine triad (HIT) family protein
LLPINKMADMQFIEKEKMTNEEFNVLAQEISRNFI